MSSVQRMRKLLLPGVLGLGLIAGGAAVSDAQLLSAGGTTVGSLSVVSNQTHKVNVINDSPFFVPMRSTITVGDTVQWTNLSQGTHTVTSLQLAEPQLTSVDTADRDGGLIIGGAFDRRAFLPGAQFSVTFSLPGTFPYVCFIHPYMAGNITVNLPGVTSSGGPVPDIIQGTDTPFGGAPNQNGFGPSLGETCITADFEKPSANLPSGVVHCADGATFQDLSLAAFDADPTASIRTLTAADVPTNPELVGRKIGGRFEGIDNAHNMWVDKTGMKLFVTEWHGSNFWTIDRMTNTVAKVTPVFTGADVTHVMTVIPGQDAAILTLEGGSTGHLGIFDPATSTLTQLFDYGARDHPHGPWIVCPGGGNGGGIIAVPFPMSNFLGFTNLPATPTGPVNERVPPQPALGIYPVAIGGTSALCQGSKFYTSDAVSGDITVSDGLSGQAITRVDLGICASCTLMGIPAPHTQVPIQIPVSPDSKYVMPNLGKAAQVAIISVQSDTVVGFVDCGSGCHGSNFARKRGGGFYHWASMQYQNKWSVTDMDTLSKAGDVALNVRSILTLQGLTPLGNPTAIGVASGQSGGMGVISFPLPPPWHPNINVLK